MSNTKCAATYAAIKHQMALQGFCVETKWIKAAMVAMQEPPEVLDALIKILAPAKLQQMEQDDVQNPTTTKSLGSDFQRY